MSQVSPQRNQPGLLWRMLLPVTQRLWPRVGTPLHVRLYRLMGGRLVGGGSLLLTTVGRRSGQPRAVVVGYLRDGEDVIVADTNIVKRALPAWELNLQLIQRRRFGSAGNGTKHGQSSSKEKIGRASGTGWWLPSQGTTGRSD